MNDIDKKLRSIYFPFLICSLCFIGGYSLLRWFLDIHLGIITIKVVFLNVLFPILLAMGVVLLFLRKPLKILRVSEKRDQLSRLIAIATMAVPTILLQFYMVEKSRRLYHEKTVFTIEEVRMTDCFRIEDMKVELFFTQINPVVRVTGKNREYMDFEVFIVAPITDSIQLFNPKNHRYWYGCKYTKRMSNRRSNEEKNEEYKLFQEQAWDLFYKQQPQNYTYLSVVNYSNDRENYMEAVHSRYPDINPEEIILLESQTKLFDNSGAGKLKWIFISFGIGTFLFLGMILTPVVNYTIYRQLREDRRLEEDDLRDVIAFLTFRTRFRVTPLLINLNLLFYLVMVLSGVHLLDPTGKELFQWGGLRGAEFFAGEYWRLGTAMFIHGGVMHLVYNCFGIAIIGYLIEPSIGSLRFFLIYILSGIGAGMVGLWWHPDIIAVGASGAIFGIIGLSIVALVRRFDKNIEGGLLIMIILGYGGISLLVGFFMPDVDNAAHIGGLVTGILVSFLFTLGMRTKY